VYVFQLVNDVLALVHFLGERLPLWSPGFFALAALVNVAIALAAPRAAPDDAAGGEPTEDAPAV
jgi:hypothetical protein